MHISSAVLSTFPVAGRAAPQGASAISGQSPLVNAVLFMGTGVFFFKHSAMGIDVIDGMQVHTSKWCLLTAFSTILH